jgi:peptidoglycan/xylan/chitin deacetylase (PgdA/CDA1 family)
VGPAVAIGIFAVEVGRPSEVTVMRVLSLLFHDVYENDPSESGFSGLAADRYKLTGVEFGEQLMGLARVRHDRPIFATELPSRQQERHWVPFTITVDDGGISYYTTVADRLESLGWRGHCFITTRFIGQRGFLDKQQIRDLHSRGHVIGSHSASHPRRFSACGWGEMVCEWEESRKVLADILGQDVTVASVPGGYFSPNVARAARKAGLKVLFTSEPETYVRSIAGCTVMGRFTMRRGYQADFAHKLGILDPLILFREWIIWNAKKTAKALLGAAYPHLMDRWGSYRSGAKTRR